MLSFVEKMRGVLGLKPDFDPDPAYQAIVAQARTKALYKAPYLIPNTLDGRYDSLCLHMYLVLRRLGLEADAALASKSEQAADAHSAIQRKAQAIQNRFFKDMDLTMREIGIGDMTVGKHVTRMAKAYFGRVVAYEQSITDPVALSQKLQSNILRYLATEEQNGDINATHDAALRLAAYCSSQVQALEGQNVDDILAGHVRFIQP